MYTLSSIVFHSRGYLARITLLTSIGLELTYNTLIKYLYIIEKTAIFAVGGTIQ